ncbi:MAG TPA: phosphoribosylformylglycinamidine cyclo-ligase [Candidatus Acidoferrum sp.]|nr:phosphoribosylformylglycinamidine cyclo-ligase [Candidatus Acidoferrum sp.]
MSPDRANEAGSAETADHVGDAAGPGLKGAATRTAYADAGVDVSAGDRAVELMRGHIASTRRPEVVGGLGGFGGAVAMPAGYREPLLVSSTDGVGTKTAIATAVERFDTVGRDLVAMCADDVVCTGAEPLFFLDYIAVGRLDPVNVAELVGGVAAGCRDAGCALVGGETAEHPGVMDVDAFDLAGCCVGVVERSRYLDGTAARPGDAIVGLAASGLHANGFSLVRGLVARFDLDLQRPYQEQLVRSLGESVTAGIMAAHPEESLATLGHVLLTPTTIYARAVLGLRAVLETAGRGLAGVAHITGGGLPGNVPRALPAGLGARLEPARWPLPSVMRLFAALGGLEEAELRATFNGGIGMVVVVPATAVEMTIGSLRVAGIDAWLVGEVAHVDDLDGRRYVEGELRGWPAA